jgi:hypothetical protein
MYWGSSARLGSEVMPERFRWRLVLVDDPFEGGAVNRPFDLNLTVTPMLEPRSTGLTDLSVSDQPTGTREFHSAALHAFLVILRVWRVDF